MSGDSWKIAHFRGLWAAIACLVVLATGPSARAYNACARARPAVGSIGDAILVFDPQTGAIARVGADGRRTEVTSATPAQCTNGAFLPDGSALVYLSLVGAESPFTLELRRFAIATGNDELVVTLSRSAEVGGEIHSSPSGTMLTVVADVYARTYVVDVAARRTTGSFTAWGSAFLGEDLLVIMGSPGVYRIVDARRPNRVRKWVRVPRGGRPIGGATEVTIDITNDRGTGIAEIARIAYDGRDATVTRAPWPFPDYAHAFTRDLSFAIRRDTSFTVRDHDRVLLSSELTTAPFVDVAVTHDDRYAIVTTPGRASAVELATRRVIALGLPPTLIVR